MTKNNCVCEESFTRNLEGIDLEVNRLTVGCISSKNNNFNLDQGGNLTVRTITATEQDLGGDTSAVTIEDVINLINERAVSVRTVSQQSVTGVIQASAWRLIGANVTVTLEAGLYEIEHYARYSNATALGLATSRILIDGAEAVRSRITGPIAPLVGTNIRPRAIVEITQRRNVTLNVDTFPTVNIGSILPNLNTFIIKKLR